MTNWEVFYTPHTDDETIGMAGAIVNARELGHSVLVVLVTDNQPSTRGLKLFPENAFSQRRTEWTRAMTRLDVTDIRTWELREAEMEVRPGDVEQEIARRMMWLSYDRTVVHHHTVWGEDDVHVHVEQPTLAHVLCANAARRLRLTERTARISLHGVYLYSAPYEQRRAPIIRPLSAREHRLKKIALDCYKPSEQCVGYGYASVPELFDAAAVDAREFTQEIPCS